MRNKSARSEREIGLLGWQDKGWVEQEADRMETDHELTHGLPGGDVGEIGWYALR
jgi:hypothetical protein